MAAAPYRTDSDFAGKSPSAGNFFVAYEEGEGMKTVRGVEFYTGSREEKLPDFTPEFPYLASRAELDYYQDPFVPWHWHRAIELFYIESGELRYETPNETMVFSAGTGGMMNSNILHKTEIMTRSERNIQLLHIFEPEFLGGSSGSLIEKKYILPVITASCLEIIRLDPQYPDQAEVISRIRKAFGISEKDFGYEIKIREALSRIWLQIFPLCDPFPRQKTARKNEMTDKMKEMMIYIHDHYSEKISVRDIAGAAFLSERECYRVFRDCLHMTPGEYVKSCRLRKACRMLRNGREPVTEICYACGLGSASYFGKLFREYTGCTPLEYRRKWQDRNIN